VACIAFCCCVGPATNKPESKSDNNPSQGSSAEIYFDGKLPVQLQKLDLKYQPKDCWMLETEVVLPALQKAGKQDPIKYILKYAKEIHGLRKTGKLRVVYVVSFCRNDKRRPIEVMPNVQGQPAREKDKKTGKQKDVIMLFLPALDEEISKLKRDELKDLMLTLIIHEYRHIVKERSFTDDTPYPLVVASEAQIWEEQIKEMFPQMKRAGRYLQPEILTHMAAYQKLNARHPSQWVSYVAKYLAHPQ